MLNPDLKPDDRLIVDVAANLGKLVEAFIARDFRELTTSQIQAATGLKPGQVRGLLHTGWSLGWVRPVQDDPNTRAIDRWALGDRLPQVAEAYRRSLVRRAQELDDQFQRFVGGVTDDGRLP